MTTSNQQLAQKPKFSVMITTQSYQNLINNTLRDPDRARSFTASITSAVAVNPALQECDAGTILAGALLGESLKLSPSRSLDSTTSYRLRTNGSRPRRRSLCLVIKVMYSLPYAVGSTKTLTLWLSSRASTWAKTRIPARRVSNLLRMTMCVMHFRLLATWLILST